MKLAYHQLKQHLTKTFAPIYLITGDETLLVQETMSLLRKHAQVKMLCEHVRLSTEGSEWAQLFYTQTHSLSLFANKRILELDLRQIKLNQAHSNMLQTYAENPVANTFLIIASHKLDKKVEQSRWYKALDQSGVIIPIWPVTAEQLPQWIIQRAKKFNLTISFSAASILAQQVEGNLLAAAQEIEKLCLLQPESVIDEDLLREIITNHTHFDVFNLVDSILAGNSERALKILRNLIAEDVEPTLIIWALTRELYTMAEMHQQIQQGITFATACGKLRIWEKRQASVRAFLKRYHAGHCWDFLLYAAKIDHIIKGAEPGNISDELERWILTMTGNDILIR